MDIYVSTIVETENIFAISTWTQFVEITKSNVAYMAEDGLSMQYDDETTIFTQFVAGK